MIETDIVERETHDETDDLLILQTRLKLGFGAGRITNVLDSKGGERVTVITDSHPSSISLELKQLAAASGSIRLLTALPEYLLEHFIGTDEALQSKYVKHSESYFETLAANLDMHVGKKGTCRVRHLPMYLALTSNVFTTQHPIFPPLSPGTLPKDSIDQISADLCAYLDHNDLKDSLFVVGDTSTQIAKAMAEMSELAPRRRSGTETSVLLIDRVNAGIQPRRWTWPLLLSLPIASSIGSLTNTRVLTLMVHNATWTHQT